MKTIISICRKVSDNNDGSYGASAGLEIELPSALIEDPVQLPGHIRKVFRTLQQAVDEELTRQMGRQQRLPTATTGTSKRNGQTTQWARSATKSETALVTGNFYAVRDQIKALGGRWDSAAKAWRVPVEKVAEAKALVTAA